MLASRDATSHRPLPFGLLLRRRSIELELPRHRELPPHVGPHPCHGHVEVVVQAVKVRDHTQRLGFVFLIPAYTKKIEQSDFRQCSTPCNWLRHTRIHQIGSMTLILSCSNLCL